MGTVLPVNKSWWIKHYISTHPTLFSKGYLFSEEGPENGLCPPCIPLGSQHVSAILPPLLISGAGLDNAEQQLGCWSSCPQCCPITQTPTSSREAEYRKGQTATSPRAHLLPSLVRCLLHTSNRRTKAKICTLYACIINFLITGLEVHLAASFCCKTNYFSFFFATATEHDIFSQLILKLPLLAVLACI